MLKERKEWKVPQEGEVLECGQHQDGQRSSDVSIKLGHDKEKRNKKKGDTCLDMVKVYLIYSQNFICLPH